MHDNYKLNPKISIITVCFNSFDTIEQTIQSVVNQTYSNIEYIIIDGASTDGTTDIIRKYSDKISFWSSEPDKGIYDAMNKGVARATGDYIYFLGSDDCLANLVVISKIAQCLANNSNVDILGGSVWLVDGKSRLQKNISSNISDEDVANGYMFPHQGMFTRSNLLRERKFDTQYKIAADYEHFLYCYLNVKASVLRIDEPIAYYDDTGISSISNNSIVERIQVMRKYQLNDDIVSSFFNRNKKRQFIKAILRKVHLWSFVQRHRGWIRHKCNLPFCRWCKR